MEVAGQSGSPKCGRDLFHFSDEAPRLGRDVAYVCFRAIGEIRIILGPLSFKIVEHAVMGRCRYDRRQQCRCALRKRGVAYFECRCLPGFVQGMSSSRFLSAVFLIQAWDPEEVNAHRLLRLNLNSRIKRAESSWIDSTSGNRTGSFNTGLFWISCSSLEGFMIRMPRTLVAGSICGFACLGNS